MADVARFARVSALVAPAVPLGAVAAAEIARGWRPTSDDAAIAWRTWDVFSGPVPLDGQFTQVSAAGGHAVFDLGPLQYYLLAVFNRIDPVHGLVWGAALIAAAFAAISVEAAWRAGGVLAGVAVSAGFLVMAATQTRVLLNLPWNPNLGLFAFSATLVLAIVTATGRTAWLPAAVVAGSIAAQCHLVFAAGAILALVGAVPLGYLARSRSGRRMGVVIWQLLGAVLLGLLTLTAPLVEQFTGHPGNLSRLLANLQNQGPSLGTAVGLRAISRSTLLPPAWARPAPPIHGAQWFAHFLHTLFTGSAAAGLVVIALVFVIGLVAAGSKRSGLASLCVISALAAAGVAWTLGGIAVRQMAAVTYLEVVLWPVGMLLDAALVAAIAVGGIAVAGKVKQRRLADEPIFAPGTGEATPEVGTPEVGTPGLAGPGRLPVLARWSVASSLALAPLLTWSLATSLPATSSWDAIIGGWPEAQATAGLAARIEARHPRGPVLVQPGIGLLPNGLATWSLTEAIAYQLKIDGLDARLSTPMAPEFGTDATAPARIGPGHGSVFLVEPCGHARWCVQRIAHERTVSIFGVGT